ncbi:MAG: pyridoxamine 5'-phosphate oxidase [Desulfuromonadales bacterium]|nr:pyridoxamine 5'-phosphate oxidase [Desulfuromonadales bacterium]MBN2792370.1 pyridoxamine 5'-phosphate oxidase [Desulfuromonadales bacterium]
MDSSRPPLELGCMDPDPLRQFSLWLRQAEAEDVPMPIAMTLATADDQGRVSARIVLLRDLDPYGFLFYTNYESRKGRDLTVNSSAALVFHWLPLARQIRIEGSVETLSAAESDCYFSSRPRGNQLAAHASPQSRPVTDRHELEKRFEDVEHQYYGKEVPRPSHWGGYRVVPEMIEFWQEGEHRLHDRLRYRRDGHGNWLLERLGP